MFYNGRESILFERNRRRKGFGVREIKLRKSEEANQAGVPMCRGRKTQGRDRSPLSFSVTLSLGT